MTEKQREKLERARTSLSELKANGPLLKRLEFILRSIDEVLEEDSLIVKETSVHVH